MIRDQVPANIQAFLPLALQQALKEPVYVIVYSSGLVGSDLNHVDGARVVGLIPKITPGSEESSLDYMEAIVMSAFANIPKGFYDDE